MSSRVLPAAADVLDVAAVATTPSRGRLYLLPVPLGRVAPCTVLPEPVCECAGRLTHFVAENAKSARAFLKSLPSRWPLQSIQIQELHARATPAALAALLAPALAGEDLGLVSEAGCPAIADPGAALVALAHRRGIRVVPLVGPSAILLALMASGLNGQRFSFHGYLPAERAACADRLRQLEDESRREGRTQVFIETPYRNRQLLAAVLAACQATTSVCIASDLTLASETIITRTVADWRRQPPPAIDRRATVFALLAGAG